MPTLTRNCCPPPAAVANGTVTRPNGDVYHPRSLADHTDVAALRTARDANIPFLLYGPPGTGKTALIEAACDTGFELVAGSGDTEVSDFMGSWVPAPDGTYQWSDGPLLRALKNGVPLYVDEIALISPVVLSVLYPLLDGRGQIVVTQHESETVAATDGFFICGSFNPHVAGASMSEALLSRFLLHIEVTTDFDLARTLGCPAKMIRVAKNLNTKLNENQITWAPQLRELLGFVRISDTFGEELALANLVSIAPEHDRPIIAEVIEGAYGIQVAPARLGAQV